MVIIKLYNQIEIGHPSNQKTSSFITWNYYWSELKKSVWDYIQNCHSCKDAKTLSDWYNSLLKSLPILSWSWTDVIFNFGLTYQK